MDFKEYVKENNLDISSKKADEILNRTRNDILDSEDLEDVSGGAVKSTANKTWAEINAENIGEKKVLTLGEFCSAYGIDLTSKKGEQVFAYLKGTQENPGPLSVGWGIWCK